MSSITTIYTIDDTTAGDYNFDSSKIEFVPAGARLIDKHPDGTCGATYNSDINLLWGGGTLTGTAVLGAGVSGGKLNLIFSDARYVDYDANLNADTQQVGAIKFKLTPNYTGSPAANKSFVTICKAASDGINYITPYHTTTGGFMVVVNDSTGSAIFNTNFGAWSPTSGVEYEIEFNWDITIGASRLFIDGVQLGSTETSTGTRDSNIGLLRVGSNFTGVLVSNFKIDDLVIYDAVQHTANYTPGYDAFKFDPTNPTIEIKAGVLADGVHSWTETTVTKPAGTELKYVLPRSPSLWWDGGAWSSSDDTFAKSNNITEITTNIGTLDISSGNTLKFLAFLNSDGTATPTINVLTIDYDFFATVILPNKCTIYGQSIDLGNNVLSGTILTVSSIEPFMHGNNIVMIDESVTSSANGFFDVDVIETATVSETVFITIEHTVGPDTTTVIYENITIPDQATIDLETLLAGKEPNALAYYKAGTISTNAVDPLYLRGVFQAIP